MQSNMILIRAFAAVSVAALLAACGGHASSIVPTASTSGGHTADAKATLVVKIPKAAPSGQSRRPAYISSFTKSVSLQYGIGSTEYPAQTLDVTPASPGCAADGGGNTVCTLTFAAHAGTADYTVNAYDATGGGGNLLAAAGGTTTITAGKANTFKVTLDGVPASFKIAPSSASVTMGAPADVPFTISAYDADGSLIVNSPQLWSTTMGGAYNNALMNSSDPNFTVQQNGTDLPTTPGDASTYQVPIPFTNLSAHYDGTGPNSDVLLFTDPGSGKTAQLTIAVGGPPTPTPSPTAPPSGNPGTPTPAPTATPTPAPLSASPSSLNISGIGSSNMQMVIVEGGSGGYAVKSYDASVVSAAANAYDYGEIDVTPVAAGSTNVVISDSAGDTITIPVTVTTATGTVN